MHFILKLQKSLYPAFNAKDFNDYCIGSMYKLVLALNYSMTVERCILTTYIILQPK